MLPAADGRSSPGRVGPLEPVPRAMARKAAGLSENNEKREGETRNVRCTLGYK